MTGIVVGVDGSEESRDALRWALEEAALRHTTVHAVYAWTYAVVPGELGWVAPPTESLDAVRESATEMLDTTVEEVAGDSEVEVRRSAVQGGAANVLLDAAEGAELLVVGSRGRGGFAGLMLGSVSQQCAHHAACPVVILPHGERRRG